MCTPNSVSEWRVGNDHRMSDYEDSSNENENNNNNMNDNNNCTEDYLKNASDFHHLLFYTPEMSQIHSTVRWAFFLHSYGFACLFFFLAFYAFFSILNLRSQLSTRPYMSTINSFLCLLGLSRAGELFIDPYGLKKAIPVLMGTLLWDLGFPCLISSFSLIQIAFLQLTQQLEVGPEKLRKKTCLTVVITVHFLIVIASAIYSNINTDLVVVKLVFQLGFSLWGFVLCGSFLYAGKRVLGVLAFPSQEGPSATAINEKGVAGLMMASLMAPGQNLASSLTAALAPTLLQSSTPKIKITDENDRTISVASDSSRLNDSLEAPCASSSNQRPSTPVPGTSSSNKTPGQNGSSSSSQANMYVRPPSPVFPRKKSGGSASTLRNGSSSSGNPSSRRLSFRKDSSSNENELFSTRKKSLTWCENECPGKKKEEKDEGLSGASLNVSAGDKRRGSRKSMDNTANEPERNGGGGESLLTMTGGPDFTLQSILSHIAYVNQTALDYRLSRKLSRKNQVHKVIKFTSITAILGVLLCIGEIIRIISPYGFLASSIIPPSPWPWFALQTICRAIEFGMGATIANIAKQPVSRPPHHYGAYSFRHKHQRDSLYL